jgi:hypothetical protein
VRISRKFKISTATAIRAHDQYEAAELREAAATGAVRPEGDTGI